MVPFPCVSLSTFFFYWFSLWWSFLQWQKWSLCCFNLLFSRWPRSLDIFPVYWPSFDQMEFAIVYCTKEAYFCKKGKYFLKHFFHWFFFLVLSLCGRALHILFFKSYLLRFMKWLFFIVLKIRFCTNKKTEPCKFSKKKKFFEIRF